MPPPQAGAVSGCRCLQQPAAEEELSEASHHTKGSPSPPPRHTSSSPYIQAATMPAAPSTAAQVMHRTAPGPISSTRSPGRTPAATTIDRSTSSSSRKFWPRDLQWQCGGGIRWWHQVIRGQRQGQAPPPPPPAAARSLFGPQVERLEASLRVGRLLVPQPAHAGHGSSCRRLWSGVVGGMGWQSSQRGSWLSPRGVCRRRTACRWQCASRETGKRRHGCPVPNVLVYMLRTTSGQRQL